MHAAHAVVRHDAFLTHGDIAYLKYEDDWAFGFPGKFARCAVPVFESDALAMRTFIASHETNYRLAKTGPVLTVSPKRWGIYRTDYSSQGPDKLCRLLRDKFDGPPCPATAELGKKMACLRHARAANASTVKEARKGHAELVLGARGTATTRRSSSTGGSVLARSRPPPAAAPPPARWGLSPPPPLLLLSIL